MRKDLVLDSVVRVEATQGGRSYVSDNTQK